MVYMVHMLLYMLIQYLDCSEPFTGHLMCILRLRICVKSSSLDDVTLSWPLLQTRHFGNCHYRIKVVCA